MSRRRHRRGPGSLDKKSKEDEKENEEIESITDNTNKTGSCYVGDMDMDDDTVVVGDDDLCEYNDSTTDVSEDEVTVQSCDATENSQKDMGTDPFGEDSFDNNIPSFHGPITRTRSRKCDYFHVSLPPRRHKRRYIRGGDKVCTVCGKVTKSPSDLERHFRVHSGERPFQCIVCLKPFKCKRSQQSHQYLCHGVTEGISKSRIDLLACQKLLKHWPPRTESFCESKNSNDDEIAEIEMPKTSFFAGIISDNEELNNTKTMLTNIENNDRSTPVSDKENSVVNDTLNFRKYLTQNNFSGDASNASEALNETNTTIKEVLDSENSPVILAPSVLSSVIKTVHVPTKELVAKDNSKNDKSLTCNQCGRDFKTIYTLRYHQRAIHGIMVYLSPALEDRLLRKKGCWRLSSPRSKKSTLRNESKCKTVCNDDNIAEAIIESTREMAPVKDYESRVAIETRSCDISEKEDTHVIKNNDDTNEYRINELITNDDSKSHSQNLQNISKEPEKAKNMVSKDSSASSKCNPKEPSTSYEGDEPSAEIPTLSSSAQVFLPNTNTFKNGEISARLPLSWKSVQIHSESVLATKLEGIHPTTEQRYVLYRCRICDTAFPALGMLCSHLPLHAETGENICELCGAIFKWYGELELHRQQHQTPDNKIVSQLPPTLFPGFFINPLLASSIPLMSSGGNGVGITSTGLAFHQLFALPHQFPSLLSPNLCSFPTSTTSTSVNNIQVSSPSTTSMTNAGKPEKHLNERIMRGSQLMFQCRHCSKSFDRVFSLQRHERIHTGVKPCFCKICGRGFSELRNLRHHIIRFHPDGNQKDTLPRGRRPGRPKTVNSSLKLVSFLKKTAVRILNSIDQHRLDPTLNRSEDTSMETEIPNKTISAPSTMQETCTSIAPIDCSRPRDINDRISLKPDLENSSVTVVIPTDPIENSDKSQESPKMSNGLISESTNCRLREILQDPKRSLIGNKRKGRPFRLIAHQENSADLYSTSKDKEDINVDPDFDSSQLEKDAISVNDEKQNREYCDPPTEFCHLTDSQLKANALTVFQDAHISDDISTSSSFKARLRGHGAFFSSYNPRLGVVARPVARTHACKPQIGPDGKYIYPCSYCYKTFCSTSDLNRHMDFHEDIRPFRCPYCEYCSRTNSQLKVHMMRHQGIKQYLCQICNYNGVTQSDLNRHLKTRTHLLRSRNICSCCGIGFYTRSLSEEHFRICHQLKDVTTVHENTSSSYQCNDGLSLLSAQSEIHAKLNRNNCAFTYFNGAKPSSVMSCSERSQEENNNNDFQFNLKQVPSSSNESNSTDIPPGTSQPHPR